MKITTSTGLLLLLTLMSIVAARAQTPAGAPDLGAARKRAAVCFACHNADGISKIPGVPHLAGQERGYLENALRAYRDGQTRQNPTMNAMAKPLSDHDIVNIAAYYSVQPRSSADQANKRMTRELERVESTPVSAISGHDGATTVHAPAVAAIRSGEAVYASACITCHGTGAAGAPKLGDKAAWSPRLAQGSQALANHALTGIRNMPPKGGCVSCSDADIVAAAGYLAAQAK